MIWAIFLVLIVLWLLGVANSYMFGGFIHILLVLALVTALVRLFQRRRTVD
jgi:Family of unknown function (DUF5670)